MLKRARMMLCIILLISAAAAKHAYGLPDSDFKKVQPEGFNASSYNYTKIKCTWAEIEDADGYEVYRASSEDGKYSKVYATDDPQKQYYINTGRTTGKTYYYKVRGYKKVNGGTCYTRFSDVDSAYARPAKVKISQLYCKDLRDAVIRWQAVKGASGYQLQVNQKKNGKWSGWRNYAFNYAGEKTVFETRDSVIKNLRSQFPEGYIEKMIKTETGMVRTRKTVEEAADETIGKTEAWLDILQDDSVYKFRVRAYHTEKGKRIYGLWSDEKVLKETLNIPEIICELRKYIISYSGKNYPEFLYDDDCLGKTDLNSSYYVYGAFPGFSRYARQEDVIEDYKDNIRYYISNVMKGGGDRKGCLYIRLSQPDDREGAGYHLTDDTYYAIWMLH